MNKKYLLILLIIALSVLAGCGDNAPAETGNGDANEQQSANTSHLQVPIELKVLDPEANRMNIEMSQRSGEVLEEFNHGVNLSEAEKEKYEEQLMILSEELEAFQEKILIIDDQETIGMLFDKIKETDGVYDENTLDMDTMKSGDYYSIEPIYSSGENAEQNLSNGYVVGIGMFKDNRLFLYGITSDDQELIATTIRMDLDYQWFIDHLQ